jgi:hypothetical protein
MKSKLLFGASALALSVGAGFAPASAATQQGLVNVYVEDTNVQIPIAVAANVCDVSVAVLAQYVGDEPTDCDALAQAEANNQRGRRGSRPVNQDGLINIALVDTNVQVPLAVAANVCDIDIAILAADLADGGATCDAVAGATANN